MIRFVDLSGRLSTPLVVSCALWEPTGVPLRLVVSQNDECQPESLPLLCAASISICWSKMTLVVNRLSVVSAISASHMVSSHCMTMDSAIRPCSQDSASSRWPICGGVIVDTLTAHLFNGRFSLDLHVNSLDIHLPNHLAPFHRFVLTNLVAQGWQLSSILFLLDW